MAKQEGSRVLRDFKINRLLGNGGFGAVLEGQHRIDGNKFAIKLTVKTGPQSSKEPQIWAKLPAHKNVVAYITSWEDVITKQELSHVKGVLGDCAETLGFPPGALQLQFMCIQMELCGQNLRDWLRKQLNVNQDRCKNLFGQLLGGLRHIHNNGLIHRDLKPENIFFASVDSSRIKIGDFGISTVHQATMGNRHTSRFGSILYMAPEQHTSTYGKKADLYAMGLILFELYHPPAQKTLEQSLVRLKNVKKLPSEFDNFPAISRAILSLLEYEPIERPSIENLIEIISSKPSFKSNVIAAGVARLAIANSDVCKGCGLENITGTTWNFSDYPDFKCILCEKCNVKKDYPKRLLSKFTNEKMRANEIKNGGNLTEHTVVRCENCAMFPLRGTRYVCKMCAANVSLCSDCYVIDIDHRTNHEFRRLDSRPVQNYFCDGCGEEPIRGIRYKCEMCAINYCESCFRILGYHGCGKGLSFDVHHE